MTAAPDTLHFHGTDIPPSPPENALFHIIPVPLEQSVSYGTGTADGPRAILEASLQLETLTCGVIPADLGIHTTAPVDCKGPLERTLDITEKLVEQALRAKSVPVILGGEHTVTCGAIPALQRSCKDFGVIQFDAHADLRDSYEGTPNSHACVMRRIHEQSIPIFQIGTRSYSVEEDSYRKLHKVGYMDSETIWREGPVLRLPPDFPELVYITFDLDGLDSSVMPATGTPVPGGLNWFQAMWLIEQIMETRVCIGFDVVELAPIPALHASSFLAAQLTYNIMAYLVRSSLNRAHRNL
jgi:agmatinase